MNAQLNTSVTFLVQGTVKTNQRHRHGGGRTWTPAKTKAARREIVEAFLEVAGPGWKPHEGPVRMSVRCSHLTPKSGWPGMQCNRKPDLDNVAKLVGDALNKVAYRDDAQICELTASKRYGDREGTQVTLEFLEPPTKPKHGRVKEGGQWYVYEHGEEIGRISKTRSRYEAGCKDGQLILRVLSAHHSGNWRTLDEAEAAIKREVGL